MNRVKKMMKAREAGSLLFLVLLILLVCVIQSIFNLLAAKADRRSR